MIKFVKDQRDKMTKKKHYFHIYQKELLDKGVTHTDAKIQEKIDQRLNELDDGVDTMVEAKEEIEALKKLVKEETSRRLKAEHMYSEIYESVEEQHNSLNDQHKHLHHDAEHAMHHNLKHSESLKKKEITKAKSSQGDSYKVEGGH